MIMIAKLFDRKDQLSDTVKIEYCEMNFIKFTSI